MSIQSDKVDGSPVNSAAIDELKTEVRVVRDKIADADTLLRTRIEAMDKRNDLVRASIEQTKKFVDERAKIFNIGSATGIVLAFILLFWVVYSTAKPVAEEAAKQAAKAIDWNKKVNEAADAELKTYVTPEALAKAVDANSINDAVAKLLRAPEFARLLDDRVQRYVSTMLENKDFLAQLSKAVSATLDKKINSSARFEQILQERLNAESDRLKRIAAAKLEITATDRDELRRKLIEQISKGKLLRENVTEIDIYPYDDALQITARVIWQPGQKPESRFSLYSFNVENLNAITADRRDKLIKYFGQDLPKSVNLSRSKDNASHKFAPDYASTPDVAEFSDAARLVTEQSIDFIEDCFGLSFPATWRLSVH